MERLVRLASVLHYGGKVGVPASTLIETAGFADGKDAITQLNKDLNHLRALGWLIENIGAVGEPARYRMTGVDNRLRVKLTPEQQVAIRRAVLVADRADLVDRLGLPPSERPDDIPTNLGTAATSPELSAVVEAVRDTRLVHFTYKGKQRTLHPESLRRQNTQWYLRGCEDGDDTLKTFVVPWMKNVTADPPGSATRPPQTRHQSLHPMTWEVDPPVDVTLEAPDEFVPDVRRWLGVPQEELPANGETQLVYRVTNRSALRSRIYLLGRRVRVVGPDEVRDEMLSELSRMAGE